MKEAIKKAMFGLALSGALVGNAQAETTEDYINKIRAMDSKQLVQYIKTPEQAQRYLNTFARYTSDLEASDFTKNNFELPFEKIHEHVKKFGFFRGDCEEAQTFANATLSDNGYQRRELVMILNKKNKENGKYQSHSLYPFQKDGKWGTIGINNTDYHSAKYPTLEKLCKDSAFEKEIGKVIAYFLRDRTNPNYILPTKKDIKIVK
ncbi:MAG: hypothetical protein QT05_C0016G0008 [archaeon GW2011_AR13]|nr:MAG: hypothetical protein QT05_C0016G0008 [archaeon GW2011_AR13]HIG95076.1 hypothetical protein [Nanoarchaeota archaeon]HIH63265.1 hypothetical protein [Nanoarchaeota archaeon]HIJ09261.1 hypothetical protein [Nanoarchaeota archaeon]